MFQDKYVFAQLTAFFNDVKELDSSLFTGLFGQLINSSNYIEH